jgi:hypothetical protein
MLKIVVLVYKSSRKVDLKIKNIFNIKSLYSRIIKLIVKYIIVRKGK